MDGTIGWQAVGIAPVRPNWSGLVPVPDADLPVRLPEIDDYRPDASDDESAEPVPALARVGEEWRLGAHGQKGVNCFDCHRAEKGEPDAFEHNGATIAVIVSPKDCSRCHSKVDG